MGWVRLHKRFGAWPGLAAIALQIVLSFGHVHAGNVHVEGLARSVGVALASVLGHSQPAALAEAKHKPAAPNPVPSSGDDNDYCAICASIFLASTSLAAEAPTLLLPIAFERVTRTYEAESGFGARRPAFFQSRAPPAA